jgi:hypothetical protein
MCHMRIILAAIYLSIMSVQTHGHEIWQIKEGACWKGTWTVQMESRKRIGNRLTCRLSGMRKVTNQGGSCPGTKGVVIKSSIDILNIERRSPGTVRLHAAYKINNYNCYYNGSISNNVIRGPYSCQIIGGADFQEERKFKIWKDDGKSFPCS